MMPRNPIEADWLIRSAEEEAARAERWAAVAQQQMAYQAAMAKAHAADAAGLRALWTFASLSTPGPVDQPNRPEVAVVVDVRAPDPVEPPKCEFCGKPTRLWQGKPQRFCTKDKRVPGSSCAIKARDQKYKLEITKNREIYNKPADTSPSCDNPGGDVNQSPSCLQCGKPTRYWRGVAVKFCQAPKGRSVSSCATYHNRKLRLASMTTEQRAEHNRRCRRPPTKNEKYYVRRARERKAYKARRRERERNLLSQRPPHEKKLNLGPEPLRGSVIAAASPRAAGRELLASVYAAVSVNLPPDLRLEIISETALLVLEGAELEAAVKQASKNVRKNAAPLRYTKPIDDCFWLAAESSD